MTSGGWLWLLWWWLLIELLCSVGEKFLLTVALRGYPPVQLFCSFI